MRNQIYLAGGIQDISWKEATKWRDKLASNIYDVSQGTWHCFDPCDHMNEFGEVISAGESMRYDLDHLRHSRLMIASFEFTQKSTGTLIELGVAYENNIPIIIYNPVSQDVHPLHPWVMSIATHICTSESGLYQFLCDHYLNEA